MAGFWRNLGSKIVSFVTGKPRELPKPKSKVKPNAAPRELPADIRRKLGDYSSLTDYRNKLEELTSHQDQVRAAEATMFDETQPEDVRKAALAEYADLTGWYRPENNNEWSNEEWRMWEQIYEPEPEVF